MIKVKKTGKEKKRKRSPLLQFSSKPGEILASRSTVEKLKIGNPFFTSPNESQSVTINNIEKGEESNNRKIPQKRLAVNKKDHINRLIGIYQARKEGFNHRHITALRYLIHNHELDNSLYQSVNGCDRRTASRDLKKLVEMKILERIGKGRGTYYILSRVKKN